MRAVVLAVLLLAPGLAQALPEDRHDVIVLLRPGAMLEDAPDASRALRILDAVLVPDASPRDEARMRAQGGVLAVLRDEPLERTADPNLRLTRADPTPPGPVGLLTGAGITIAIVDSGIDSTHPDLAGRVKTNVRLVNGRFLDAPGDPDGHGTHVAGILAADGSTSEGKWRGVAPGASLVGVDISDRFTTTSALLAYDWLYVHRDEQGIRAVVNAWGRVGEKRFDANDPVIRAVDRLVDAGVVVLFSASNHGPGPSTLSVEAQNPRVITVGAVDAAARLMTYSSRGPAMPTRGEAWVKPDVVAPGDAIVGLRSLTSAPKPSDVDAFHREYSGTSQAVPHVGGIVALMLEADPTLTPAAIQNALREAAVDLGEPGPDDGTGFGLVDALDAVNRARGLAVDRGNVLVAGGVDRFEDGARLDPVATRGGLLGLASASRTEWSTTFPVKSGATRVGFELGWTAPASNVVVALEREGSPRGSWTQSENENGRIVVRGRIEDPEPGTWTLHARSVTPLAVSVTSVIDVQLQANATRALEMDGRYRLPDSAGSAFGRASDGDFASILLQTRLFLTAYPGVLPSALAGYLFAFIVLRRRK